MKRKAKPIMIQGTMSNVGKSVLAGGLCRVFVQDGYRTAPFKSQNMALNSYITEEGLEMGRAQVMQAEAAKIRPLACMNPILLKPTNDTGSQVILNGEVKGVMAAREYYRHKKEYIPHIMKAYQQLEEAFEVIVIEGAGSPAEINLKQDDIVNMGMAKMADAPVLLAADIDRGGVFAQLVGTMELLEEEERSRVKGVIINKFRGDKEILRPGLEMLEEKIHVPVLGVVPYFYLDIDEEDSLSERFHGQKKEGALLDVAVIRFPRISNFTDLMPLEESELINLRYVSSAEAFGEPDAVILPGSKNTIADLRWMRQNGLEAKILKHASRGNAVLGICGGYQMMGQKILDEHKVEGGGTIQGLGLLPMETAFEEEKTRTRVQGIFGQLPEFWKAFEGAQIKGYEIHMGRTETEGKPVLELCEMYERGRNAQWGQGQMPENCEKGQAPMEENCEKGQAPMRQHSKTDGCVKNNCMGCYVHGFFDDAMVVKAWIKTLLKQKGLPEDMEIQVQDQSAYKETQYDQLAEIMRENLDMEAIYRILEGGSGCSI